MMDPSDAFLIWLLLTAIAGGLAGRILRFRGTLIASVAVVVSLAVYCGRHYTPPGSPNYDENIDFELYMAIVFMPTSVCWLIGIGIGMLLRRWSS